MPLKLATKFDPQPQKFEIALRAGFRHAELWLDEGVLAVWQPVVAEARRYPIGYALHFPNQLKLGSESLEQTVALYQALDCFSLVIHQPMYDKFHSALSELDPALRFAVENHRLSVDGFDEWAEVNPGLALDVEHLWKFTLGDASLDKLLDSVRAFLTRFAHKLRHIHLPGYWPGFREHRPMYCARDMILPVFSLLAEFQFAGLVVSEIEREYQNVHELSMDVALFETWREQYAGR